MAIFDPDNRHKSRRHARLHTQYAIAYTGVDFLAAIAFVVGSVMFFFEAWQIAGTWLFLIGSIFFMVRPSLSLARELHYAAIGEAENPASQSE